MEKNDILEMTSETIGIDLLKALIQEIKLMPNVWDKLSEQKQEDIITRIRKRVENNVRMAVHTIASENRTTCIADLDSISIKDDVKAIFRVSKGNAIEHLQALYDSVGKACLLVVVNPSDHLSGMDEVRADPDQHDFVTEAQATEIADPALEHYED